MKKTAIFALTFAIIASFVSAQSITSFVNDNAGILTSEEEAQITLVLQNLYNKDIAQISIVTINSLEGQPIETVAFNLAEGKLGSKDKNNGLLLLIVVEDREYRFEVGRGLEPIFNDAKVGRYGREYLVPAFQQEAYRQGILLSLNEINKELTGEEIQDLKSLTSQYNYNIKITKIQLLIAFFFFIILLSTFIGAMRSRNKDDKYFWVALIASQMLRGKGPGFGGSGGGFGGFGGGSVGGGGASGRW